MIMPWEGKSIWSTDIAFVKVYIETEVAVRKLTQLTRICKQFKWARNDLIFIVICQAVSPVVFYLREMKDSSVSFKIPYQFHLLDVLLVLYVISTKQHMTQPKYLTYYLN